MATVGLAGPCPGLHPLRVRSSPRPDRHVSPESGALHTPREDDRDCSRLSSAEQVGDEAGGQLHPRLRHHPRPGPAKHQAFSPQSPLCHNRCSHVVRTAPCPGNSQGAGRAEPCEWPRTELGQLLKQCPSGGAWTQGPSYVTLNQTTHRAQVLTDRSLCSTDGLRGQGQGLPMTQANKQPVAQLPAPQEWRPPPLCSHWCHHKFPVRHTALARVSKRPYAQEP